MGYNRFPTSEEVISAIMQRHRPELMVFGTISDPDGHAFGGAGTQGRMETEYGFAGKDFPLLVMRSEWDISCDNDGRPVAGPQQHSFWLCVGIEEDR